MNFHEAVAEAEKKQKEMMDLQAQLENKKAEYKAFTKEHFGLVDGEQTDVLQIAKAMKIVQSK